MAYDGAIQFDIAMNTAQFEEGLQKIVALLENLDMESTAQKLAAQFDLSDIAGAKGSAAGQSFASGLLAGCESVATLAQGGFLAEAFAALPALALQQGALADAAFATGLGSGQSPVAAQVLAATLAQTFGQLALNLPLVLPPALTQMAGQLEIAAPLLEGAALETTTGIAAVFGAMAEQTVLLVTEMLAEMRRAVAEGAPPLVEETQKVAKQVTGTLAVLPDSTAGIMPQVFAGMAQQMDALAPALYQKAAAIAHEILRQLRKAFDIHSPSKKTQEIAGNVMQGLLLGLTEGEKEAFGKVDTIANGILERFGGQKSEMLLTVQEKLGSAVWQNQQQTFPTGAFSATPAAVSAGARVELGGLTQNFYAPKAPSPAEATQQGLAFLEQARWKLPQMVK